MNLSQLERIKTELKRGRYGLLKIQGPRCEDWKLPVVELRKDRGIYIIMYIKSWAFLQKAAEGFMCRRWGFLRGL
jgi:hypothetical protein